MADLKKFVMGQKFYLAGSGITAAATTLLLSSFNTPDGTAITMTDIGTIGYMVLEPGGSNVEVISFTGISGNTITGVTRGLNFRAPYTASATLAKQHAGGTIAILSNPPQLYDSFANKDNDETVNGTWQFLAIPSTTQDPVGGDDLVRKSWVLSNLPAGAVSVNSVIVAGTAGETLVAGNLVYLDTADGKWKKADADTAAWVENVNLGIAQGAGINNGAITGGVLKYGMDTHQSGLTPYAVYYASNTAGGISATVGTKEVTVGVAYSATSILFDPGFNQELTEDQQDALAGTGGTPSATNKYITEEGTSNLITRLTEETSSGITAGVPVFMQSDAEASKVATIKNFIITNNMPVVDRLNSAVGYTTAEPSVTWLTQNRFVGTLTFKSATTTWYQFCFVGTMSDEGVPAISGFEQITGGSTSTYARDITRLSDTSFVIVWNNSSQFSMQVGSLSATNVLTMGSNLSISSWNAYASVSRLTDTSFILAYINPAAQYYAVACVCTVSGTTITQNGVTNIDTTQTSTIHVAALSATQAVVSWSVSGSIKTQTLNISGTTVTNGASIATVASVNEHGYITALSSTKFAVAYNSSITTGNVMARVATVSGDNITYGTALVIDAFQQANAGALGIAAFGNDVVVSYMQYQSSAPTWRLYFAHVAISGTVATLGSLNLVSYFDYMANDPAYPTITTVNGTVLIPATSAGDAVTFYAFKPQINEVRIGIAKTAPVSGVVPVIMKGRTGSLYSGLTFNKRYNFNQDGTISENGVFKGGRAISTTELLLE